jgi:hypothetical protein
VRFADGTMGVIGADRNDDRSCDPPVEQALHRRGGDKPRRLPGARGRRGPLRAAVRSPGQSPDGQEHGRPHRLLVAIEALRRLPADVPHDLYFVFSVQEEVGTRGAEAAANRILPDVGIALDVTLTGDVPEARPMSVRLGDGPAIKVRDSGMIAHAGLVRLMRRRAEEAGITYQMEVLDGGTTDARPMQVAGPGCAAGCISIPCRYVHTPSETVDARDVEGAVQLLVALLSGRSMEDLIPSAYETRAGRPTRRLAGLRQFGGDV